MASTTTNCTAPPASTRRERQAAKTGVAGNAAAITNAVLLCRASQPGPRPTMFIKPNPKPHKATQVRSSGSDACASVPMPAEKLMPRQTNPSYSPYQPDALLLRIDNQYAHAPPLLAGPRFR